jgi:hypothetical protein
MQHAAGYSMEMEWVFVPLPDGRPYRSASTLYMLAYGFSPDLPATDADIRQSLDGIATVQVIEDIVALRPDVVVLHEAPSLGLTVPISRLGVPILWRYHLGLTTQNRFTKRFWSIVNSYLKSCARVIAHDDSYVPKRIPTRLTAVRPGIDPRSLKNSLNMTSIAARSILVEGISSVDVHSVGNSRIEDAGFLIVNLARWSPTKDPVSAIRIASQMVRLEGFEPPTLGSVDRCSNPLSYSRVVADLPIVVE